MSDPYVIGGAVVGIANAAPALLGFGMWASGRPGRPFWLLARAGAVLAAVYAVFCAVYALLAAPPPDDLLWVYVLTPVAVSYFAEQLRLVAATTVLEKYGFASAAELRAAAVDDGAEQGAAAPDDPSEQGAAAATADGEGLAVSTRRPAGEALVTGIAHEVVLRETLILATGSLVIAFLAWRAWLLG